MFDKKELAIDGGDPVISDSIPSGVSGPSIVGEEEIQAVAELLRSQALFFLRCFQDFR